MSRTPTPPGLSFETDSDDESEIPAKTPADYVLPVGTDARPGRGWLLVDYNWDEDTGHARLIYRNRWDTKKRLIVEVPQPAAWLDREGRIRSHTGWRKRPPIDRAAVLARYHESLRHQATMQAAGVYGR